MVSLLFVNRGFHTSACLLVLRRNTSKQRIAPALGITPGCSRVTRCHVQNLLSDVATRSWHISAVSQEPPILTTIPAEAPQPKSSITSYARLEGFFRFSGETARGTVPVRCEKQRERHRLIVYGLRLQPLPVTSSISAAPTHEQELVRNRELRPIWPSKCDRRSDSRDGPARVDRGRLCDPRQATEPVRLRFWAAKKIL